jgi:phytoene dehydrogenase-like protein
MKDRFDVIIIGSGIGGLVCGAKLAKEGQKVLILERHALPGGCVTSVRKKGYNFDYGAHLFGSCNKDGILRYYLRELGVSDLEFIRLDPADRFVFPDMAIDVPQGIDEYMEKLRALFP